jgi:HEAT repeat protein
MKRETHLLLFFLILVLLPASTRAQNVPPRVTQLLRDLKSQDYKKAWHAATELSRFPKFKKLIIPDLIAALNNEWKNCSGDIREDIAYSLAQLRSKEAVFPMLELLKSGKSVAHECAECGCCFAGLTPADQIVERSYDPFCENSLLKAIHELADFSHSKAMADLVSSGKWQPELLITIGKVGLPRYAHFIARHKDDKNHQVRIAVARALGLIDNDAVAVPVLIQMLSRNIQISSTDSEDFLVKWEASNSLSAIGKRKSNEELKKRLVDLLQERDKITLVLAARTAGVLGTQEGVLKLREMALDKDPKVCSEAMLHLGELFDTGSKDVLMQRLRDENLAVRANAIYALGQVGDPSIIPVLRKAFEDASDQEKELQKRIKEGADEQTLREKFGLGELQAHSFQERRRFSVINKNFDLAVPIPLKGNQSAIKADRRSTIHR